MADRLDLKIRRGETFRKVLRWGAGPVVYRNITAATRTAPCVLTVVDHGVPDGWLVAISNVVGMTELNAPENPPGQSSYLRATVRDADTIELNAVNAAGFKSYKSGGVLQYFSPIDLTGWTARLQVRESVDAPTVLLELTTENGGIEIDAESFTVTLTVSAVDSEALDFVGVYDLELVSPDGTVIRLLAGECTTTPDVTR